MSEDPPGVTRRGYVGTGATLLVCGLLAGCAGGESESEPTTNQPADGGTTSDGSSADATTASGTGSGGSSGDLPALSEEATEYLSDARLYSGDGVTDYTGQSELAVANGAGDRGMAFDPAAVAVDAGTTVTWQWTGRGGEHDVVAVDGAFESELVDSNTETFSHTFEATGEFLYNCSEHEDRGMRGVVVVV